MTEENKNEHNNLLEKVTCPSCKCSYIINCRHDKTHYDPNRVEIYSFKEDVPSDFDKFYSENWLELLAD
jgi:hypothetical protein